MRSDPELSKQRGRGHDQGRYVCMHASHTMLAPGAPHELYKNSGFRMYMGWMPTLWWKLSQKSQSSHCMVS